jgi:single-strand DNA-binding protein
VSTMTFVGRLGRDAELKYTPNGDAVINLAVAYNYGRKAQDGRKPSQWVDASLFGKRAEALAQYLVKGSQLFLMLDDVHVRTYSKQDGTQGFALTGSVQKIEFVGSALQQHPARAPDPAPAPRPQQAPHQPPAFDDFDTDIPF